MTNVDRIRQLLDQELATPVKDGAGIVTAAGVDSAVRVQVLKQVLRILNDTRTTE